jgi:hypothetical protein
MSQNVNCLEGKRCPKCGQNRRFLIFAMAEFCMTDDGAEDNGDIDYGPESRATCPKCKHSGPWKIFEDDTPFAPSLLSDREPAEMDDYCPPGYSTADGR